MQEKWESYRAVCFDCLPEDARRIREVVFVEEQGFRYEFDEIDEVATHMVFYCKDRPVATSRIYWNEAQDAYAIGRFAVVADLRGKGLGLWIVERTAAEAKRHGAKRVILHAQTRVRGFYERAGFTAYGAEDAEEGIPHIWMQRRL